MTDSAGHPALHDARLRIIDAGVACVIRDGVHGASMSAIAAESNVSKSLLHYHFVDRAQLIAEVVTALGKGLVEREHGALERGKALRVVDLVWHWLHAELERGELYALLELRTIRDAPVQAALEQIAGARHTAAVATVNRLFSRLDLTPRVPVELIGMATVAFIDGLTLNHESVPDTRVAFDVFWLAILSLGD